MKRAGEEHPIFRGMAMGIGAGLVAIPVLFVSLVYLVWDSIMGGDVFSGDESAPFHRQQVKIGNPIYGPRHYVPRWHIWLAVAAHFFVIPAIALLFWVWR
jgi:hypothetical protein